VNKSATVSKRCVSGLSVDFALSDKGGEMLKAIDGQKHALRHRGRY